MDKEKKYLAIIHGYGEGCHYTIGCNLRYETIEAKNLDEAKKKIKAFIDEEYDESPGCIDQEWAIEYVDLYELGKGKGRVRYHRSWK